MSQRTYPTDGFLFLWKNTHFETDFFELVALAAPLCQTRLRMELRNMCASLPDQVALGAAGHARQNLPGARVVVVGRDSEAEFVLVSMQHV